MKTATAIKADPRPPIDTFLTPRQAQFYKMLPRDEDQDIEVLYLAMFGKPEVPMQIWQMQQYIGSFVSKMNRRLRQYGEAVKPGRAKQTYRLTAI